MRVVNITDVRDELARAIRDADTAEEPTLVLVESQPAAYIVGARQYEELVAERKRLRREIVELEVEIGMEQVRRGEYHEYKSAADLMADIEAEIAAESESHETAGDASLSQGSEATHAKPAKGGRTRARSIGGRSR
jgi:PHD/YefM family antitoxin component YafN of YafNO toxin-antitoxin module